jgi:hypothetical protein
MAYLACESDNGPAPERRKARGGANSLFGAGTFCTTGPQAAPEYEEMLEFESRLLLKRRMPGGKQSGSWLLRRQCERNMALRQIRA